MADNVIWKKYLSDHSGPYLAEYSKLYRNMLVLSIQSQEQVTAATFSAPRPLDTYQELCEDLFLQRVGRVPVTGGPSLQHRIEDCIMRMLQNFFDEELTNVNWNKKWRPYATTQSEWLGQKRTLKIC